MKRNSWMLWGISGLNLGLGIVVGWLITNWAVFSSTGNSHYQPNVKPLPPPQIGGGNESGILPVPEPVELGLHSFEFNRKAGQFPGADKFSFELEKPLKLEYIASNSLHDAKPEIVNHIEQVPASYITQSKQLPDPAEVQQLIKNTTSNVAEQQLWEESLKDLPQEAVEDILKFRRQNGLSSENSLLGQLDVSMNNHLDNPVEMVPDVQYFPEPAVESLKPSETQKAAEEKEPTARNLPPWKKQTLKNLDQQLKCLETTASIHAYNLANSNVPWFRKVIPQINSNGLSGAEMKRTEVSPETFFSADHGPKVNLENSNQLPEIVPSNHPYDITLTSGGFFQIRDPEDPEILYARGGRLVINDEGQLCLKLKSHEELFLFEPAITVKSQLAELDITAEGLVQSCQQDEEGNRMNYGKFQIAVWVDLEVLDELEPGLFIVKENQLQKATCKTVELSKDDPASGIKLQLGKTAKSTVDEQQELNNFEKTLDQITHIKKLRQQILAE